jgi:DNA segregation ATPase FtsK/SpoIIIE, S-DNA-T family
MAKKSVSKSKVTSSKWKSILGQVSQNSKEFTNDPTAKLFIILLLFLLGFFSFIALISFIGNWPQDYSLSTTDSLKVIHLDDIGNAFGTFGNWVGMSLMLKGFGVSALLLPLWIMAFSLRTAFNFKRIKPLALFNHFIVITFLLSTFIAWVNPEFPSIYSGLAGFQMYQWLSVRLGHLGVMLVIAGTSLLYAIAALKITSVTVPKFKNTSQIHQDDVAIEPVQGKMQNDIVGDHSSSIFDKEQEEDLEDITPSIPLAVEVKVEPAEETQIIASLENAEQNSIDVQVEVLEEKSESDRSINKKVKEFGEYDPKLDLSRFQLPKIDLLKQYGTGQITFDKVEIEQNKDNIVNTLRNYNIEIKEIKATIGPTVTLYEIVPAAGIRISKIKSLEDDIALSLAALGIRIIAPMPGKGTIGIEVPNANPQMVSMKQVIASKKFQEADMELPIAMGRTITNENFIFDLTKMPHLLMAGATGQGKSVGLNAILTSLLYKKHPSQLKFVLVDPKKVELTLYNKIERHYLAMLPDTDEAIITDTGKVVATLNSLCIEMDNRYELLKGAMVRNIKEYNAKFIARRLNPEEGHKYLPYIVLVIDEFADLIMTAGKEVEMPIARLAQLARAIGIHLIVATQRPSVNVITGIIKANFPARAAFRVTSKIDSRTILDAGGADQLIGKGDMLFSQGSDLVRLQCAFVDTPEVENICDFIGNQQAYPMAYQLPEFVGEEGSGVGEIDPKDRDVLFEDAARLVVASQQGSTSMIQRKLKLGYNRAGRIVDQLEAAGILGQFEGSKARQVLITDETSLEQKLKGDV